MHGFKAEHHHVIFSEITGQYMGDSTPRPSSSQSYLMREKVRTGEGREIRRKEIRQP
jgi:hypothetical protein